MKKVKGSEESSSEVVTEDATVQEPEGLSLRDALEVAIEGTKEVKDDEPGRIDKSSERVPQPAPKKTSDNGGASGTSDGSGEATLQPPAEYNAEEKADFVQLSRKGQEAQLRLDRSRKSKIEEVKAATREHDSIKSLADSISPYLKATGIKDPAEVALKKAVKMWQEFEYAEDPKAAAAAYLKAKGIEVPKELLTSTSTKNIPDPQIAALQEKQNRLESRIVQDDLQRYKQTLATVWSSFEQEKNASGKQRYPDISTPDSGPELARNIGSLVNGLHPQSEGFFAYVKARIPNPTDQKILEEGYKWFGGQVDDSETPRSQDSQSHIAKSRRAASSIPGRGAQTASSNSKKFGSFREAAEHALHEIREREGE